MGKVARGNSLLILIPGITDLRINLITTNTQVEN